jgi:hypothetical protein
VAKVILIKHGFYIIQTRKRERKPVTKPSSKEKMSNTNQKVPFISENLNILVGKAGKKMHSILEDEDTYEGIPYEFQF